jgi:hypothetical protein
VDRCLFLAKSEPSQTIISIEKIIEQVQVYRFTQSELNQVFLSQLEKKTSKKACEKMQILSGEIFVCLEIIDFNSSFR